MCNSEFGCRWCNSTFEQIPAVLMNVTWDPMHRIAKIDRLAKGQLEEVLAKDADANKEVGAQKEDKMFQNLPKYAV